MVYEQVFRELPYPVALVDGDLTVRDATPSFAERLGVAVDGLVGARLTVDESREEGADERAGGTGPRRGLAAVGHGRRAEVTIRPVAGHAESLSLVTVEEAADGRLAELLDSLRALKHELNNPLTGALGNINLLLRRGDLDDRARRRLMTAEQEIKKVSLLVMRLSELAPVSGRK